MALKELVVKQQEQPFGFSKPKTVETVALELASGKIVHIDEDEHVTVYNRRSELEKELNKSGKTEIVEKTNG